MVRGGEIFMGEYDSCRLIALNFLKFVKNPFTEEAEFDFKDFYETTYEAMRLSDDLVDLELEYVKRILDKIESDPESEEVKRRELELWKKIYDNGKAGRRTGLGFTALGDMLAAVGLKYDSEEGLEFVRKVMNTKMKAELDCTTDMAIFRGPFEGWDRDKEWFENGLSVGGANDFYEMLLYSFPSQASKMFHYGRRNVSFSTVAPVGTVSMMTQTTSGIEPLFMPWYKRRRKINPNDEGVKIDFVDELGDKWTEYFVLHPQFKEWMIVNDSLTGWSKAVEAGEEHDEDWLKDCFDSSPWRGATANDIDWVKRVSMQGIVGDYTTHSISSTINLPEDVSVDKVSEIYMESWKRGLKGVTIYREGSRSGVLISSDAPAKVTSTRPEDLQCDIYHNVQKGEKFTTLIGLLDGVPYEIFCIPGHIATGYKNGVLHRLGGGKYSLDCAPDESYGVFPEITDGMPGEMKNLCIAWSYCLRYGMPVDKLVTKINQVDESIVAFSKVVARNLAKYVEVKKTDKTCPNCNEESVIFEEGCLRCTSPGCGWSAC